MRSEDGLAVVGREMGKLMRSMTIVAIAVAGAEAQSLSETAAGDVC